MICQNKLAHEKARTNPQKASSFISFLVLFFCISEYNSFLFDREGNAVKGPCEVSALIGGDDDELFAAAEHGKECVRVAQISGVMEEGRGKRSGEMKLLNLKHTHTWKHT